MNTATNLNANNIRVPSSGLQIVGGPINAPALSVTPDIVEYAPATTQYSTGNGSQQEFLWNTTPLTKNGFSWLVPSQWYNTASSTGGGSIFTPGANGLGLYNIYWQLYWSNGNAECFILKNKSATASGIYGTNNMKAVSTNVTTNTPLGRICSAQILISSPTDYIAFGWYNGTGSSTSAPLTLSRTFLRIVRQ